MRKEFLRIEFLILKIEFLIYFLKAFSFQFITLKNIIGFSWEADQYSNKLMNRTTKICITGRMPFIHTRSRCHKSVDPDSIKESVY